MVELLTFDGCSTAAGGNKGTCTSSNCTAFGSCRRHSARVDHMQCTCRSWLDAAALRLAGGPSTMGTCVVGETVCVDVEIFNPLQVREVSHLKVSHAQSRFISVCFCVSGVTANTVQQVGLCRQCRAVASCRWEWPALTSHVG